MLCLKVVEGVFFQDGSIWGGGKLGKKWEGVLREGLDRSEKGFRPSRMRKR